MNYLNFFSLHNFALIIIVKVLSSFQYAALTNKFSWALLISLPF